VVHPVRQTDVDRVDLVVGEQRLVGAVGAAEAVLARVRLRLPTVAASHRDDLDAVGLGRAVEDLGVDVRGREQAETKRVHAAVHTTPTRVRSPRWR
jgi:hypothetical protein